VKEAEEQAEEDGTTGFRKPMGVKEAERLVAKIEGRMAKVREGARDRLLTFEQLGIDDLTIDEAHEFKNLFYSSRLTKVRGMGDKLGSRKAADLYNKVRVLRDNGGAVTFMTGTPVSNSVVELYTMMRYLAPSDLREMGMEHFDAWRAQFVDATPAFEPNESGRLQEVTRLGRTWSNMRNLMDLYYGFTDAVTNDDIKQWYREDNNGKEFPIPKVKGGERQLRKVTPTPAQEAYLKEIIAGFDGLPNISDVQDRNAERLRLMDRARKLSLDIRAALPGATSKEEGGKLDKIAAEVKQIGRAHV
jgi:N12 class adenine-specific DNA methylase